MLITTRSIKAAARLRLTLTQNSWFGVPQFKYSSTTGAVKLAFNVINSSGTNANLPPVVIMHGLFGSKQNWRTIGKGLNDVTKRKIYTVDARNHGDSPHSSSHSVPLMALDVLQLLKDQNISRATVMGHSMGGRAMMSFALQFPERVEKAIIVDVSPFSIPDLDHMKHILFEMQQVKIDPKLSMADARPVVEEKLKKAVSDEGTVEFIMLNLRKKPNGEFEWRMNAKNLHATFDHLRDSSAFSLPPFNGPVLFIGGNHSSFLPKSDWPAIQKIFPKAQLKWMDSHHLMHFDMPQEFIDLVSRFLSQ